MDPLLYTIPEAASRLRLSVSTIYMLVGRGLLVSRKLGKKRLITHASLIALSQKNLAQLWPPKRGGKTVRRPEKLEAVEAS
jgi:excisionase family DNA binding protein